MSSARLVFALHAAAALLAVGGVAMLVRPAPSTAAAPALVADVIAAPAAVAEAGADPAPAIVAANVFAAARRPPRVRYRPGGPIAGASDAASAPDPATTSSSGTAPEGAVPALFGTFVLPGASTALLRLDPSLPAPQTYREGERAGGYVVERILEQSVILAGPRGRVTLRLRPEERRP